MLTYTYILYFKKCVYRIIIIIIFILIPLIKNQMISPSSLVMNIIIKITVAKWICYLVSLNLSRSIEHNPTNA